jgi:hypothetical protein
VPGALIWISCELCPDCSVPLLQDEAIVLPDCVWALSENGELAGNADVFCIAVAV